MIARNRNRLDEIAKVLTQAHSVDIQILSKDLSLLGSAHEIQQELERRKLPVEILINNAGVGVYGSFHHSDWDATEAMLRLNMITLTHLTHLLLPNMLRQGHGKILNVASTAAFQPGPLMACYFASKAYVLSFTQALANELTGTGITVTAFCPGPTKTQFQKRSSTENIRENSFTMEADHAVKIAYRGLMKEKALVIPGFFNKLLAILVRFSPSSIVLRVTRFLEEKKT